MVPYGRKWDEDGVVNVNFRKKDSRKKSLIRRVWNSTLGSGIFVWVSLSVLACGFPALAHSQQAGVLPGARTGQPGAPGTAASVAEPPPNQQLPGTISGIVNDPNGGAVAGARVSLTHEGPSPMQEVISGSNGEFYFDNVAPGPFYLTVIAADFNTQTVSGILRSGEVAIFPRIVLGVSSVATQVQVTLSRPELAEYQFQTETKQRVLGFIPNFYVTYSLHPMPLTPKRKFELAWRTARDPVTLGLAGAIAGVQQTQNNFSGYGRGAQGYAKRYGAAYADLTIGTFIGAALLPTLLKQDPRYFYKGSGSKASRFLYAIANSVICKGDNGRWQPDYSGILGNLAAGGISNLYYPAQNRSGMKLAAENALIGIGATAVVNVIEEFFIPRPAPKLPLEWPPKS
jgi:Carboxypeptidase regulatory-like domain